MNIAKRLRKEKKKAVKSNVKSFVLLVSLDEANVAKHNGFRVYFLESKGGRERPRKARFTW